MCPPEAVESQLPVSAAQLPMTGKRRSQTQTKFLLVDPVPSTSSLEQDHVERTPPRRRGWEFAVVLGADSMPIRRLRRNRHGIDELNDPLSSARQEKGP